MDSKVFFELINEKHFSTFGLVASETESEICTFVVAEDYIGEIKNNATMVLCTKAIADKVITPDRGVCVVDDPRILFFKLHNYMTEDHTYCRQKFSTVIEDGCEISELASIAKENVVIKKGTIVEEFVVIRENTEIERNCVIRAGTILGGGGFEHKRIGDEVLTVHHVGGIKIGSNVEIAHNCCIENGIYPWADTTIGDNCRIDNLVLIAHACSLGKGVFVAGPVGFGGRVMVGENTWIGYGAMIRNGIKIGNNARVNMGAIVTKNVADGESVSGNFAIEHSKFIENIKNNI